MAKAHPTHSRSAAAPSTRLAATAPADPLHDQVIAQAKALPGNSFSKAPITDRGRIEHHRALARTALRDAAALEAVPLDDGALSAEEIALFGPTVEAAAQQGDLVAADLLARPHTPSKADAALVKGVRDDQKLLLNAFRRLRFKGQRAELARLQQIDRGQADDAIDARNDTTALVALADHDDHRAWVASLPMGEGDAVGRLKARLPALETLASAATTDAAVSGRKELLRRLWTLVRRTEKRIREAGAYRYNGQPTRSEYDMYKPTPRHKRKPKAPAAKPAG